MLRTQDKRAFLVVEGWTDEIFFERFVDAGACAIMVAYGRENAIEAFGELHKSRFAGALVVVDADFDVLAGRVPLPLGLLFTDTHDVETMLVASPAFDKILREIGQEEKVESFLAKHGDLRSRLLESARPIGSLLWVSLRERVGLRFEELRYGKFIDDKTLIVDPRKMLKAVLDHAGRHDLKAEDLALFVEEIVAIEHDPWHLCSGHHLTEILAIALRKAIGEQQRRGSRRRADRADAAAVL
jgi:Protein of unknown function (DUF4435)